MKTIKFSEAQQSEIYYISPISAPSIGESYHIPLKSGGIEKGYFNYSPIRNFIVRILVASTAIALAAIIFKHFLSSSGYLVIDLMGSILVLSCIYLVILKKELARLTKIG